MRRRRWICVNAYFRPTWAEISLDALRHNIKAFREILHNSMKFMVVVKADGYGHGAIEISKEAIRSGVDYLAVAFLDEALELRHAGITAPILILGYTPPEGVPLAIEHHITMTVFSEDVLTAIEKRTHQDQTVTIHIKIDTGMGRLGIHYTEDVVGFINRAMRLSRVVVEGLYTHYASADELDKSYTHMQYHRFNHIIKKYKEIGISFPLLHCGNSAAAIDIPELSYNMVRVGISLYGLYASDEVNQKKIVLQPVMAFKTSFVMIKRLPPHSGVSYGSIYHTKTEEQIGTLPVGYADGYSRSLSNQVEVLFRGQRVPIVGRICMDQCMINITGYEQVKMSEEVVLFGQQGDQMISVDELAKKLGTINYELTSIISRRVPRVYVRDGQKCKVINRLNVSNTEIV